MMQWPQARAPCDPTTNLKLVVSIKRPCPYLKTTHKPALISPFTACGIIWDGCINIRVSVHKERGHLGDFCWLLSPREIFYKAIFFLSVLWQNICI